MQNTYYTGCGQGIFSGKGLAGLLPDGIDFCVSGRSVGEAVIMLYSYFALRIRKSPVFADNIVYENRGGGNFHNDADIVWVRVQI